MLKERKVIVGLGDTGMSCARYLNNAGVACYVMDDNPAPHRLTELRQLNDQIEVSPIIEEKLLRAEEIIVSPGVPLSMPALVTATERGVPITGDVAMFGELARAPIAAITGSNGKSTVTTLLAHLAGGQSNDVYVGGNIGTPCLDLLNVSASLYILELSSYQLELARHLPTTVSVVLNLSPDHLDRYQSTDHYYQTKGQIYNACGCALVNRDIAWEFTIAPHSKVVTFGSDQPTNDDDFGLSMEGESVDGESPFIVRGSHALIAIDDLPVSGGHNTLNVMAALALGSILDFDMDRMLENLHTFRTLEHRCELVAEADGIAYYNDSKATNVAATVSAVESCADGTRNIILILGGIGKNADFSPLRSVGRFVKQAVIFGQDRQQIMDAIANDCPGVCCDTLEDALTVAHGCAIEGDCVLFSPACSSQDMFNSFAARGKVFKALVRELIQ